MRNVSVGIMIVGVVLLAYNLIIHLYSRMFDLSGSDLLIHWLMMCVTIFVSSVSIELLVKNK